MPAITYLVDSSPQAAALSGGVGIIRGSGLEVFLPVAFGDTVELPVGADVVADAEETANFLFAQDCGDIGAAADPETITDGVLDLLLLLFRCASVAASDEPDESTTVITCGLSEFAPDSFPFETLPSPSCPFSVWSRGRLAVLVSGPRSDDPASFPSVLNPFVLLPLRSGA